MKACPMCAEEIQDAAIKCKHCGSMIGASSADTLPPPDPEPGTQTRARPVTRRPGRPAPPPKPPKAKDHPSYATYTALAVLLPVVGIIAGVISLTKSDPLDKKLGEHAIAFSVLMMFVWGFAWALMETPRWGR